MVAEIGNFGVGQLVGVSHGRGAWMGALQPATHADGKQDGILHDFRRVWAKSAGKGLTLDV